jgi:hypothetical protein
MRKCLIMVCFISTLLLLYPKSADQAKEKIKITGKSLNNEFAEINRKYGVEIITDVNSMIPDNWISSPINGKASPLAEKYFQKSSEMIVKALSEYPKDFLSGQIHGIALVDHLEFYGVEYGGTAVYEYHTIILEIKDWTSEDWVVSTIHHELNHLLVYWNDFPKAEWSSFNKSGFKYGNGGVDAIKGGQSGTSRSESAFNEGFANQYGKSAFIEDVATITEFAISDRKDFMNRALKYPIIANKFNTLKKFYASLNSYFDDDFWAGKISVDWDNEDNKDKKESVTKKDNVRKNNGNSEKNKNESVDENEKGILFYSYLKPYVYKRTFTINETYIAYYFELDNKDGQYESVDVRAIYYYPDGSLVGEFTKTYELGKSDDVVKCSWGFGWKDPGKWRTGRYKVEVYVNDDFYSEGYFNVK